MAFIGLIAAIVFLMQLLLLQDCFTLNGKYDKSVPRHSLGNERQSSSGAVDNMRYGVAEAFLRAVIGVCFSGEDEKADQPGQQPLGGPLRRARHQHGSWYPEEFTFPSKFTQ